MQGDYEKLFSQLAPQEPPAGLLDKVMNRIQKEKSALSVKRRLVIFSFGLAASLTALVLSFQFLQAGAATSGFADFFSLLFSDTRLVFANWQNYFLTLLQSLPVFRLAGFLAAIFAVLELLKFLAREAKNAFAFTYRVNHINHV